MAISLLTVTTTTFSATGFLALQDGARSQGSWSDMLPLFLGLGLIMYFVVIRPESKERKRKQAMLGAVKKHDRIVTTGGMFAQVAAVGENDLTLKFDDGPTRVRVLKSAIADVIDKDTAAE